MNFNKSHVSRNLIKYPYSDKSGNINNVQWTVSENGHIKGVGTTDGGTNFFFNRNVFFKAGTYTLKIYGMHEGMTLCIYDSINLISIAAIPPSSRDAYTTFTLNADTSNDCRIYFNIGQAGVSVDIDCDIMLNEGSTPLPYEPYSSEVWHDIPHYVHKTDTDTITTLPADIYANDTMATVGLKGQTVQSTTPTPQNPVMPEGTGERTGNLLNETEPPQNIYITDSIRRMGYEVEVAAGTYTAYGDNVDLYAKTKINGVYGDASQINTPLTLTLASNGSIIIYSRVNGEFPEVNVMLNTGSTPLPYEPYGYFIEIEVS